jgi:hypothetical protein
MPSMNCANLRVISRLLVHLFGVLCFVGLHVRQRKER